MTNPFEVLRISPDATTAEAHAAWRRLAEVYAPARHVNAPMDVQAEARQRMVEANAAYQAAFDAIVRHQAPMPAAEHRASQSPTSGGSPSVTETRPASGATDTAVSTKTLSAGIGAAVLLVLLALGAVSGVTYGRAQYSAKAGGFTRRSFLESWSATMQCASALEQKSGGNPVARYEFAPKELEGKLNPSQIDSVATAMRTACSDEVDGRLTTAAEMLLVGAAFGLWIGFYVYRRILASRTAIDKKGLDDILGQVLGWIVVVVLVVGVNIVFAPRWWP
jgi:hypothetical protein